MGRSPDTFEPRDLVPFLEALECRGTCWVAFSGGPDSTALLLALHELGAAAPNLAAVHVNHGAQARANDWEAHCRAVCETRGIPFRATPPPGTDPPGDGPEERLRRWRYAMFERLLDADDVLCTAHHLEDQAETLVLALLRGSGPAGLAAMPAVRPLGPGRLARPLLATSRAALEAFLAERKVEVIDDPSNRETTLDRNYLRRCVLPALRERWPAADRTLATSAALCAEAADLLADGSRLALAGRQPAQGVLDLHGLTEDRAALKALLRHWLASHEAPSIPRARLETLVTQLRTARPDSQIQVDWAGHTLRHHRGRLWLDSPANTPCPEIRSWDGRSALELGEVSGGLRIEPAVAIGPYRVGPRRGGERYRARPGATARPLKRWLGQGALPPWLRSAIPLLLDGERPVAVGDLLLDHALHDQLEQAGSTLRWRPGHPGLAQAWEECRRLPLQLE